MKKIVILFIFTLFLTGCGSYEFNFEHEYNEIVLIKIVEFGRETMYITSSDVEFDEFEYFEIKTIDIKYAEELYYDIKSIKMHFMPIGEIGVYGKSFLILYSNGEYDVISADGMSHFKFDENGIIRCYISRYYFDETEFIYVMKKYLFM